MEGFKLTSRRLNRASRTRDNRFPNLMVMLVSWRFVTARQGEAGTESAIFTHFTLNSGHYASNLFQSGEMHRKK